MLWLAREGTYLRESKSCARSTELLVEALAATTDYVTGIAQTGQELIIILDVDKVLLLNPTAPLPLGAASESRT